MVEEIYALINLLPRRDYQTPKSQLPSNGIYIYYERGETISLPGTNGDRIVRVGTHTGEGNFPGRIRQHYGNVKSYGGNKNGSVFRKHLGGALLRRADPADLRLAEWLKTMGRSYPEVEELVSRQLRDNFTFRCFRVDEANERLALESGLIAAFAQQLLAGPSPSWLGSHAASPIIARSGLWNTQRVDAEPLTPEQFERLTLLVHASLAGAS